MPTGICFLPLADHKQQGEQMWNQQFFTSNSVNCGFNSTKFQSWFWLIFFNITIELECVKNLFQVTVMFIYMFHIWSLKYNPAANLMHFPVHVMPVQGRNLHSQDCIELAELKTCFLAFANRFIYKFDTDWAYHCR